MYALVGEKSMLNTFKREITPEIFIHRTVLYLCTSTQKRKSFIASYFPYLAQ